ncbi:MAG: helix-turn-helix domain-containing protein [Chloroflexota bacterium]|nr:helix-turn-helix domain-containing protein [Chloroflexota bacterium]
MTKKTFGALLRKEREHRGWSQGRLAEKVGTSTKMISRWERDEVFPGPGYQQKLEEAFEKDIVAEFYQRKTLISWHLPPRNPFFIGRKNILKNIHTALNAGRATVVLNG